MQRKHETREDKHMRVTALRKKLHEYIDSMPEKNLTALKPLLSVLAEPPYIIEPASPTEIKKVEKRVQEYYKDPSSFVPLK